MNIKIIFVLTTGFVFLVTGLFSDIAKAAGWLQQYDKKNRYSRAKRNNTIAKEGAATAQTIGSEKSASAKEKPDKWEWLFDGKNTDQWIGVNSDKFPANGWVIQNKT